MTILAPSFLIGPCSLLQVIRTTMGAWMSSSFGQILSLCNHALSRSAGLTDNKSTTTILATCYLLLLQLVLCCVSALKCSMIVHPPKGCCGAVYILHLCFGSVEIF